MNRQLEALVALYSDYESAGVREKHLLEHRLWAEIRRLAKGNVTREMEIYAAVRHTYRAILQSAARRRNKGV
jgi:hypothetical protein